MHEIEHAQTYYSAPRTVALTSTAIAERLARYRAMATCAGCRQRIAASLPVARRGVEVFHPACVGYHDRRQVATTSLLKVPAPSIIGRLEGVAVLVGEPCTVYVEGGPVREQFASGAFDRWLRAGSPVRLRVDHGIALNGRYALLEEQCSALRFAFDLEDGPAERRALEAVRSAQCRGCSVAFKPVLQRMAWSGGDVLLRTDVRLSEVSLCISGRPAWCGTFCRVAAR